MKILFVSHGFPPKQNAGVERHVHDLARGLRDRHVESVVIVPLVDPSKPPFVVEHREVDGHRLVELRVDGHRPDFRSLYRNPSVDEAFAAILDEERPSVVHAHHLLDLSLGCLEAALRRGIPTVATLHDYWLVCPLGQRLMKDLYLCRDIDRSRCVRCQRPSRKGILQPKNWIYRPMQTLRGLFGDAPSREIFARHDADLLSLLNRLDAIVSPSRFHAEEFAKYGVRRDRLHVVENGLFAEPLRAVQRVPSSTVRFGYIGSVIPSKGIHVLVEAFAGLARSDVSLDVWGEAPPYHGDTTYLDRLRAIAVGPNPIRFHGRFESAELPRILSAVDAIVVPSIWFESFCLTAREAFLAKIPVIASRLGALEEAFRDNEGGLFFEAGNVAELRATLDRFASDILLRDRLRRTIPAVRTTDEMAVEMLALYESLRSRKG